jgi:hypothetical protein
MADTTYANLTHTASQVDDILSDSSAHMANTNIHVTQDEKSAWDENISNAIKSSSIMITTSEGAEQTCGNDTNNMPTNSVVCIGAVLRNLLHKPYDEFLGVIITSSYSSSATLNGIIQIAIASDCQVYTRIKWGVSGVWRKWASYKGEEDVYYVGGSSEYQSVTALFNSLKNDTAQKIIYVNPGTYDIFQEYKDLGIPTPPDDVESGDYMDRVVFLPPNTKLVGIGNVRFEYNPAKADTTMGEARTWSPLNVRWGCHVENIEIYVHNGRYCIHDDSHNAADDQGVSHIYKNVRCIYDYSDTSSSAPYAYGFNNTIGFGFAQKNNYLFEDCVFIYNGTAAESSKNKPAFYGHNSSGTLDEDESPNLIVRNCIIKSGDTSNRSFWVQSMNTNQVRVKMLVESSYIDGQAYISSYRGSPVAFDVTFLNCGMSEDRIVTNLNTTPITIVPITDVTVAYPPRCYDDTRALDAKIAEKTTYSEVFSPGSEIVANSDLNSLLTEGKFYCSSANSTSVTNLPVTLTTGISFNVTMWGIFGTNRFIQFFTFNVASGPYLGRIWYRMYSSAGWSKWEDIATMFSAYGKGDGLSSATDLDNVTTFGRYNATKQIGKTLVHSPFDNLELGLQLTVECNAIYESTSTRCVQTITYNATSANTDQFAKVFKRFLSQDGWSNWYIYGGTEMIPSS